MRPASRQMLIHAILIALLFLVLLPIYMAFDAASHTNTELLKAPIPLIPGHHFFHNFWQILTQGSAATGDKALAPMLWNSLLMALIIAVGKIILALLSAFAIVYFEFPFRKLCFWMIFITLMLPVEVRIVPTFTVIADLHLLNSMTGLTLPLMASATATFLFRQFFLTIPQSLSDAARLDGAGPLRFLWNILLPLSKTNISALFIIMFIYGWNQYLWPQVITTQSHMATIVMGIKELASVADQIPQWNVIMATALLAMIPPVLVIILLQRLFEKGLVSPEK